MALIIWWALLTVYLTGWLASIRPLAARTLDNMLARAERKRTEDQQRLPHTWQQYHPVGDLEPSDWGRLSATWWALGKALFWPVVIPVHLIARTVVTPTEKARAEKAELARFRKFAADNGLDWPDDREDTK